MKPPPHNLPLLIPRSDAGFTLVELVVGTTVGALVIVITTAVFTPLLRLNQQLNSQIRLQERWSRVRHLLDTEIQEAKSVSSFSNGLRLGIIGSNDYIYYIWDAGEQILNRSGPGIDCWGAIRSGSQGKDCSGNPISDDSDTSIVSTGITNFDTQVAPDNKSVEYTMIFRDPLNPNGSTYRKESVAQVQSDGLAP